MTLHCFAWRTKKEQQQHNLRCCRPKQYMYVHFAHFRIYLQNNRQQQQHEVAQHINEVQISTHTQTNTHILTCI